MLMLMRFPSTRRFFQAVLGAALLLSMSALPGMAARRAIPETQTFLLHIPQGLDHADDLHSVDIERGKTILLQTSFPVKRLAVGDPEIADFVAIGEREIEIIAKNVGDTNLLVWGPEQLQAIVDIHVGTLQPRIVRELSRLLDNPDIMVDVAGGSIILRGHVPTLQRFEQAEMIAQAFLTQAKEIGVTRTEDDKVETQSLSQPPGVINLLQVGGKHQVMIEVVIAELSRKFRQAFGVNIAGKVFFGDEDSATFQTLLRNLSVAGAGGDPSLSSISESVTLAGSYFNSGNLDLRIFLEAVEANNLGTILAEPTLIARSGEQANFLAGGEVPIPLVTGLGETGTQFTILFKPFGVNVEFTPTVLSKDRIHLQISPEVSEPDFTGGVRVLGQSIPSFRTRRVSTAVELGDGETFVLAGLLREDTRGETENVPGLSALPLIGQLFRTREVQKSQQELVLIVTPHLVQPIQPGTRLALPTDHYVEPTLMDFYWHGRIEGKQPEPDQSEARQSRATGAQVDEALFGRNDGEEDPTGGFVGSVGYRIKPPTPTGGIK
jgi:pilus assembly protein CpaC